MQQPPIRKDILQRLHRIATAYEFETGRFLNHIVAVALDELDGREDDYTVCIPAQPEEPRWEADLLAEPEPETRPDYHPDADPWEYGDR
jgi:hypothetical protein